MRNPDRSTVHARSASRLLASVVGVLTLVLAGVSVASGEIFVANKYGHSVTVYARTANGSEAPLRTIVGANTALWYPTGIAVDTVHDEIFVASLNDGSLISTTG